MKWVPLSMYEVLAHGGFTHMAIITADDLTEATANTTQAVKVKGTIPAGGVIAKMKAILAKPFKDKSDAAYNTTTVVVGDAGSANRYLTSGELNENGAEITIPEFTNTAYQAAADTDILATFGSQAGKNLKNIDQGELHLFLQLLDCRDLTAVKRVSTLAK
jgi:hypothetical protein